ncbi:hypothetical protein PGQ11_010724 [Apiospora arundinis]|uniref:Uncharacterized protein n=1 Tax=Apiospora arundinis TaxID=335852 RepID=A0ABR2IAL6_9PEZI
MASFDIIKLELSPYADVTDAKSVAGSLWQTTLQYVFRQVSEFAAPAVADATVLWGHSQISKHVIFLFIVWPDRESRHQFHHQSLGTNMMNACFAVPPQVICLHDVDTSFWTKGDGSSSMVANVSTWEVSTRDDLTGQGLVDSKTGGILAGWRDEEDRSVSYFDSGTLKEKALNETFVRVRLEPNEPESSKDRIYDGIVGDVLSHESHRVLLSKLTRDYSAPEAKHALEIDASTSTASLFAAATSQYGISVCPDETESWATPAVSFQAMRNASSDGIFNNPLHSRSNISDSSSGDTGSRHIVLVKLPKGSKVSDETLAGALPPITSEEPDISEVLQWGWVRNSVEEDETETLMLIVRWCRPSPPRVETLVDALLRDAFPLLHVGERPESVEVLSLETGQGESDFRDRGLTEVIRFRLPEGNMVDADRKLLEHYLLKFTATMQDDTHGEFDEYDPVRPSLPLLVESYLDTFGDDTPRKQQRDCIVVLHWEELKDRELWLARFMSYDYTILGHKAHVLGRICPVIEAWPAVLASLPLSGSDDEEEAEDDDMGF